MLITINSAKCVGIDAEPVNVEVDINKGIGIHLVGLADAAVKESLLRTITAITSCGYHVPGRKIVINLAPADVHKKGSGYDLPIALGIIAASGQEDLPGLGKYMIMGELGLDGSIRDVPGALPIAELAARKGLSGCILPLRSALEAAELDELSIFAVKDLSEVLTILRETEDPSDLLVFNRAREVIAVSRAGGKIAVSRTNGAIDVSRANGVIAENGSEPAGLFDIDSNQSFADFSDRGIDQGQVDFSEIVGQEGAKRGLEIAASGGHNVLMVGAPGCGKSSLAKALPGILPPMNRKESIVVSKIYSVAGKGQGGYGLMKKRPFRSPHYSSSLPAILGGGTGDNIMPGEVSLAQSGVLFLDEYMQMPKTVSEALRAPLEDRVVTISRLRSKVEYPASFMLVAAANPCPCGYYGEGDKCRCSVGMRQGYMSRLSGPVLDRIDVQLWLHSVDPAKLVRHERAETSAEVAARVMKARQIQQERFRNESISTNAEMSNAQLRLYCPLSPDCKALLEKVMTRKGLSARAYTRIIKLARTIADLSGSPDITVSHISEAVSYRFLDRVM